MYLKALLACTAACALSGCATVTDAGRTLFPETTAKAYIPDKTQTQTLLEALPAPDRPVGRRKRLEQRLRLGLVRNVGLGGGFRKQRAPGVGHRGAAG